MLNAIRNFWGALWASGWSFDEETKRIEDKWWPMKNQDELLKRGEESETNRLTVKERNELRELTRGPFTRTVPTSWAGPDITNITGMKIHMAENASDTVWLRAQCGQGQGENEQGKVVVSEDIGAVTCKKCLKGWGKT